MVVATGVESYARLHDVFCCGCGDGCGDGGGSVFFYFKERVVYCRRGSRTWEIYGRGEVVIGVLGTSYDHTILFITWI